MQIEHLAFNLPCAREFVAWFHDHLGMPIQHQADGPVWVAFLGEPPSILEVYDNPDLPRYPLGHHPAALHLAFYSDDLTSDIARLVAAGAEHIEGEADADGYGLAMLRCPFGLPIQLCNRREPVVPA